MVVRVRRVFTPRLPDVLEIFLQFAATNCKQGTDDFAAEFGFTINQIRDWEQGRTRPLGGLRAYLMLIKSDPQAVLRLLRNSTAKKRAAKAA